MNDAKEKSEWGRAAQITAAVMNASIKFRKWFTASEFDPTREESDMEVPITALKAFLR